MSKNSNGEPGDSDGQQGIPQVISSALTRGTHLSSYEILGLLGKGGMGEVYRARDTKLGREVAIKLLPGAFARDPERLARFQREARLLASLNHPNIATIYGLEEAGEVRFLVLELVPGETFAERLAVGPLELEESLPIYRQIAEALEAAHEKGIIHRDLKPANVKITPEGKVKVLDFGIAKELRADACATELSQYSTVPAGATEAGVVIGTRPYMSPEQLRGKPVDKRTDIWSFGCVLYEGLTGRRAFAAETVADTDAAILAREPDWKALPATTPPRIRDLLRRCLQKDSNRRLRDAGDARIEITEVIADHDGARPATAFPLARRVRRRVASVLAALAIGLAALAGGMWLHSWLAIRRAIPDQKYMVVLPFKDLSGQAQGQLFADGLAETLRARLAKVSGIQLMPPSGETASLSTDPDIPRIAQNLGANLVLCGAVQRAGDRIRITYSLLNAQERVQIAGDAVTGSVADVFAMEDQVAESVLSGLRVQFPAPSPSVNRVVLRDAAAHDRYLQALGYLQREDNEASVDGAIGLLEKLIASEGDSALFHAAVGRAYLFKYKLTRQPNWADRAVASCDQALQLDQGSPEVQVTLGNVHAALGRYPEAINDFHQALKRRRDNADAFLGMADAYKSSGRLAEAEQAYNQAISLRPNFWGGYNELGKLFFSQGQYARAAQMWLRVVELSPDNTRGYNNLGNAYYHLGRDDEALVAYSRSIGIRPTVPAYTGLGMVQFMRGKYAEAVPMFEKAKAHRPDDPIVWGNLGDAYRWAPGLADKAATAFDRAITLMREQLKVNPNDAEAMAWLAEWLAKRGDAQEAVQTMQRALALGAKNVQCMAHAMRVYHLVGNRAQALRWLKEAVNNAYTVAELERDPELASLRTDSAFQRIIKDRQAK